MSNEADGNAGVFTCYTCAVGYSLPQLQRDHYKTEWHRYNLKRKVACLPPVTEQNFEERARIQKEQAAEKKHTTLYCDLCHKQFSCENAYNNHVKSRKHKESEVKLADKLDTMSDVEKGKSDARETEKAAGSEKRSAENESTGKRFKSLATNADSDDDLSDGSWSSYEGDALGVEECLFCPRVSPSLEANLAHMTIDHSFFIPDAEYLADVEGLLSYLGAKVGEGHLCLWCCEKGRKFQSARAAQGHMIDKGHCKMLHEGDTMLEYSDFYDYSPSYPDYKEGEDENEDEDNDIDMGVIDDEGYELILPSGARIGHRSLMRYYKQNVPEKRAALTRKILPNVLSRYKALGWTGTTGELAVRKAADLKFVERARRRYDVNRAIKANKLPQHFRDDNGMVR